MGNICLKDGEYLRKHLNINDPIKTEDEIMMEIKEAYKDVELGIIKI
jgi:hypothetical protein